MKKKLGTTTRTDFDDELGHLLVVVSSYLLIYAFVLLLPKMHDNSTNKARNLNTEIDVLDLSTYNAQQQQE